MPIQREHGRLQLPPAERLPRVLGVQRVHRLGLPAVRAAVHRRHSGDAFAQAGQSPSSLVPRLGSRAPVRPASTGQRSRRVVGDDPNNPRDPDRGQTASLERSGSADGERTTITSEKRLRFVPSGLANEVLLDVVRAPARRSSRWSPIVEQAPVRRLRRRGRARRSRTATASLDAVEADPRGASPTAVSRTSGCSCRATVVRSLRRDARDQRRPARAALRAEPARLGPERASKRGSTSARSVAAAGPRQPLKGRPLRRALAVRAGHGRPAPPPSSRMAAARGGARLPSIVGISSDTVGWMCIARWIDGVGRLRVHDVEDRVDHLVAARSRGSRRRGSASSRRPRRSS